MNIQEDYKLELYQLNLFSGAITKLYGYELGMMTRQLDVEEKNEEEQKESQWENSILQWQYKSFDNFWASRKLLRVPLKGSHKNPVKFFG